MMQVSNVQTTEELQTLLDSEEFSFRFEFGFGVPSCKVTLADREDIVKSLSLHNLIYANKAEIDQLKEGLQTHGVLSLMERYPHLFRPLLQSTTKPLLTASQMMALFKPQWSLQGSNRREKEELIMLNWTTYLDETQGTVGIIVEAIYRL